MAAALSSDPRRPMPVEATDGTEGLPRAFLHSLRTLFDILDDGRRGAVHIQEIESRWRGADTLELPRGVLECLRRAAPPSGLLTFERFVQGLRSSLSKTELGHVRAPYSGGGDENIGHLGQVRVKLGKDKQWGVIQQLTEEPKGAAKKPPPLGTRYMNGSCEMVARGVAKPPSPHELIPPQHRAHPEQKGPPRIHGGLTGVDGNGMVRSQSESTAAGLLDPSQHQRSRGDHRRHTITNGVDYGMLKRMKELEQEKDFLIQGLEALERARDWYHQQIQLVQERQKQLGKSKTPNDCLEENQVYPNHLLPRLQEVHHCLKELVSTPGKTLSSSSSALNGFTATASASTTVGPQQSINMLKEQNKLLTQEVTSKSDRITQLEQEKSALIKQLFEARARNAHDSSQLDSTFI
ncbi:suppressor APC domain-containing protein 2 [Ambystoma mexicanum]|uniref:suppressor APC domain-containing protein 2 n=1 Tax=Ambystoma mexicanum TaxID=8296 RepID=UPI0037E94140